MDSTRYWDMRIQGVNYNDQLKPATNTRYEANRDMYNGNQWANADVKDLPKPVFNIIKRIITFFVANLTSTNVKVKWNPIAMRNEKELDEEAAEVLTAEFEYFREVNKYDDKLIEVITDAAITGDMCFRFYFDQESKPYDGKLKVSIEDKEIDESVKGEIKLDVINGNMVYFGDSNVRDIQKQPWVQIETREMIKDLKEEAKDNKEDITTDSPTEGFDINDGDIEIEGKDSEKATVIYTWEKKKGKIVESKSTENVVIYENLETGLSFYPIAWGNWQTQKNQYHGIDVVREVINNQLFINRAFAQAMMNILQVAYPKGFYRSDLIAKPSNAVGAMNAIKDLPPGTRISDILHFESPGDMSVQVMQLIDAAFAYTKEVLGISDAALGSINPEQASGTAIVATQKQAEIPLGIPRAAIYNFVEDGGNIFCDMCSVYYGLRPVVMDGEEGKEVKSFDFDSLQEAFIKSDIDVGASSYWSELAQIQTLDTLFAADRITAVEYFERVPDGYIIDSDGLLKTREEQVEAEQLAAEQPQELPQEEVEQPQGLTEEEMEELALIVDTLPVEAQQFATDFLDTLQVDQLLQILALPVDQRDEAIIQLMEQQGVA